MSIYTTDFAYRYFNHNRSVCKGTKKPQCEMPVWSMTHCGMIKLT